MNKHVVTCMVVVVGSLVFGAGTARAQSCAGLPDNAHLHAALAAAQAVANGGFGLNMWATVVHRSMAGQSGHIRTEGQHSE